jgi:tetratricopeptide (TPR) repeat protein
MKKMGVILTLLLFISPLAGALPAQQLWQLFAEGNNFYQKGDYAQAEQAYRRLIQAGADGASLYYNLGNACFKQKRLGEAIFYWEKARRQSPADPEIEENLRLANLLIVDRIESPPIAYPLRLANRILELISPTQASWLTLALFAAANALFIWHILARRAATSFRTLIGSLITGALFFFFACTLLWKIYDENYHIEGVIVEQKVDVRSGPGTDNITVFTVHEGTKVTVRGTSNGWCQVSLPNGWNGWLEQRTVAVLSQPESAQGGSLRY